MSTAAILGLIGSLAGTAATVGSNIANTNLNERNRNWSEQMQREQFSLNEQAANNAANRTRELYNDLESPTARRKQLEEAGLSVGLMYGQGGAGGSLAAGPQGQGAGSAPTGPSIQQQPIFNAETALLTAQAAKLQADTRKSNAEAAEHEENLPNIKKEGEKIEAEIREINTNIEMSKKQQEQIDANIQNTNADTKVKEASKNLLETQNKLESINLQYADETAKANLDILKQTAEKVKQDIENLKVEKQKLLAEIRKTNSEKRRTDAETANLYKQADLLDQQIEIGSKTLSQQIELKQKELEKAANEVGISKKQLEILKSEAVKGASEAEIIKKMNAGSRSEIRAFIRFASEFFKALSPLELHGFAK